MSTYLLSCRLLKFKHAYRLDGDCFMFWFFSRLSPERLQETTICCCSAGIISYNVKVLPVLTDWWNKVECVQIKTENVLLWNQTPQQWSSLFVTTLMNMATFQNQKQLNSRNKPIDYTQHMKPWLPLRHAPCLVFYTPRTLCWNTECLTCTQPQTNSEWPYFYYRSVLNW